MTKTLIVFGAGTGTGRAIAQKYAREGYQVALVARRLDALEELKANIGAASPIEVFAADIADLAQLTDVTARIRQLFGSIDAVAFTAASSESFTPAASLTSDQVRRFSDVFLYPVIDVIGLVMDDLKASEAGAVLYVNGASALGAPGGMSGPAPSMAAARNYLLTLREELASDDVFVGAAFIAAIIQGSAIEAAAAEWGQTGEFPTVNPADIAASLWERHNSAGDFEVLLPAYS